MEKRSICVVIGSRANYSSIKSVMRAVDEHPDLELQIVAFASALLDRYGSVVDVLEADGFTITEKVYTLIEGETPLTMAKSTGLGLLELPTIFEQIKPDVIITVGDRFETMATAVAAIYMNIPLAHTMGGEVSGSVDEIIRHAITKMAQIHFPATKKAAERIILMGENPEYVFHVGCPRIDLVSNVIENDKQIHNQAKYLVENTGVGGNVSIDEPFLLVAQYPVTTEFTEAKEQISETLMSLNEIKMPTIMLWPNPDAGSAKISQGMRVFREHYEHDFIRFFKNFPPEVFFHLISRCACMVGNSSAAIREGAFMGTPAVNIGNRQRNRERGRNVIDIDYNRKEITEGIKKQIKNGRYPSDNIYGDGHANERIASILARCELRIQKVLTY